MLTLNEYIKINEGVFNSKTVDYNSLKKANNDLELFNISKDNIRNNAELEKLYFNSDLKLGDGDTVKNKVNISKVLFKRFALANYVTGSNTNELNKMIAKAGKIDVEVGTDTFTDSNSKYLLRYYSNDNKKYPMVLAVFK